MKRYRVENVFGNFSIELEKGTGTKISFFNFNQKWYDVKMKHGGPNGLYRYWFAGIKNYIFQNFKKSKEQGIRMKFGLKK